MCVCSYLCHDSWPNEIQYRPGIWYTYRVSQKKVAIGPPKPQFLSETFEIFVVGRFFHRGFSAFFKFEKNLILRGPKRSSKFSKIAKKQGTLFYFFQANFFAGTNAEKNPNFMLLDQNLIKVRFLEL